MDKEYGAPPDQLTKLRILVNNPNASGASFLKPKGFESSAKEYVFFYETMSPYGFVCPDGRVRIVEAINYYWECLGFIKKSLGITDIEIAKNALSLANTIDCSDSSFDKVFKDSVLMEIEDKMEIYRNLNKT